MTHDLLVDDVLRILEVLLCSLEAFPGGSACRIELGIHLVANVFQDVLLHVRIKLEVRVLKRLE